MTTLIPEPESADLPQDESPDVEQPKSGGDFDPEFPGSTPDAPYGFKDNGEPYKRRPKGHGKSAGTSVRKMPASESLARTAAGVLASANVLVGLSLSAFGLTQTAESIGKANADFETMAYNALLNDPALCRKILSAGATGGKTQLALAYASLAMAIFPAAKADIQERKALENA